MKIKTPKLIQINYYKLLIRQVARDLKTIQFKIKMKILLFKNIGIVEIVYI